jgi:hypothetical protein
MAAPSVNKNTRERFFDHAVLFALSILSYLPLANRLGYYRDDWGDIWGGMQRGLAQLVRFYLVDRPFKGYFVAATFAVIGGSPPLVWHIYACFLRFAGGVLVLWILRLLWPKQRLAGVLAAGIFIVYPGFLSQPLAVIYQLNLLALDLGLLSLGLTVAIMQVNGRFKKVVLTVLGVLSALLCYIMFEYMIGLELARLFILIFISWNQPGVSTRWARIWRVGKLWLPYLAGVAPFLIWRVFFFSGVRQATDLGAITGMYVSDPLGMALRLILETPKDWIATIFLAWGVPIYNLTEKAAYPELIFFLAVALAGGALLLTHIQHIQKPGKTPGEDKTDWTQSGLWLGGLGVLAMLLPVLLAGRDVYFTSQYDHYTLQAAPFVGLFLVAGISRWFKPHAATWILIILIVSGLITQNANAAYYSKFWEYQRQLWWQLSWRAPDIEDGSVLVPLLPGGNRFREGWETWAPANLIYRPGDPYIRIAGIPPDEETLLRATRGEIMFESFRGVNYIVWSSRSLVMSLPSGESCLHVLDGASGELSSNEGTLVRLIAPQSQVDLIVINAQSHAPPENIFGKEPAHDWCYYYQKAGLARQRQDWALVAALGDEASQQGLVPQDVSEWMPFYVGYAHMGRIDDANVLGVDLRNETEFINDFCSAQSKPSYAVDIEEYIVENLCVGFESSQ